MEDSKKKDLAMTLMTYYGMRTMPAWTDQQRQDIEKRISELEKELF